MSEIDYERVQFLHDVATECARDGTEIALDADEVILYLTEPLLALRERAEPDQHEAHIRREVNVGGNTWVQCSKQAFEREKARGALCRVLYESPPEQVVPEEMTKRRACKEYSGRIEVIEAYRNGFNACRAAMLAAPTHVATSEVTQDFKPVSRKKCRKCDQEVFGYTVNGLCDDCYMYEQANPVLPECFERLLRHSHGIASGTDWNNGTAAKFHRDPLIQAVKDCRAIFTRQPLSVEMLAGSLRNAPLAPADNQGRQRPIDKSDENE
ncbi:hypothetical protein ACM92Y_002380 [Cronobacter malonaticus]